MLSQKTIKISSYILIVLIIGLVLFYTRFEAISWNDRSRFATINALVTNHNFIIEHVYFTTGDKVFINGHFYSDKPPLFSVLAAVPFFFLHLVGFNFSHNPALLTFITAVLVMFLPLCGFFWLLYYWCKHNLKKLEDKFLLLDVLFLAAGTALLPFTTQLNNHLPTAILLGVAVLIFYYRPVWRSSSLVLMGACLGLTTTFDLSAGFVLALFGLLLLVNLYKEDFGLNKKIKSIFIFGAVALIPIFIHCLVNIQITGDVWPGSMHPEFFNYPSSQFTDANLTGAGFAVSSFWDWLKYLWLLTFGERGFFLHNPVILLGFILTIINLKKVVNKNWWYNLFVLISTIVIILYYSLFGKGGGGGAYSVRWFIVFIPLFFPIILQWLEDGVWRRKLLYFLAIITLIINIFAMGNILGGANHGKTYSFINMLRAFPGYTVEQVKNWSIVIGK